MDPGDWLESEEAFEARCAAATRRLEERRRGRTVFLRNVIASLEGLVAEAGALGDRDLEEELRAVRGAAEAELAGIEPGAAEAPAEVPAAIPPPPPQPVPAADAAAPAVAATAAAEVRRPSAPAGAVAPEQRAAPVRVAAAREPALAAQPAPAPAPPPADRAAGLAAELDGLREAARELPAGEEGLLRLKAAACRLRRVRTDLQAAGRDLAGADDLYGALLERVKAEHGSPYVPALDPACEGPVDRWDELARAYEELVLALETFDWLRGHFEHLNAHERSEVLEAVGAAQQRLFRLLDRQFHGTVDAQQRRLYKALKDLGEAQHIYLESLDPRRGDAELERRAAALPCASVRSAVERRLAQAETLRWLQELVSREDFGTREADPEALQAAARACLEAGIAPSNKELRDALLDWESLLEGGDRLRPLITQIGKERDRRAAKGESAAHAELNGEASLDDETRGMLQEILPFTRGKRCLFLGGHVQPEHRKRIRDALELSDLEWPPTDRTDANPREFAGELRRSDIVVLLIRFMRKGFGAAAVMCREEGKPLVRLPRGLGLNRVIHDFYEQLPRAT